MKALLVVFVLVALAVFALYKFTDLSGFDPQAQHDEFKAQIQPGMSWSAVVDIRAPKKIQPLSMDPENISGRLPEVPFDRAAVEQALADDGYPAGFIFTYLFGEAGGFEVYFDDKGNVTTIEELVSLLDMAQGKRP